MRSLYLRIAIVFTIASVFSLLSTWWISGRFWGRAVHDFFAASVNLEIRQASRAYESGGPNGLKDYLAELDTQLKGTHYFTDAAGRDLVTGVDRSNMLTVQRNAWGGPRRRSGGRFVIPKRSSDGKYYLIIVARPPFEFWPSFWPYVLVIVSVIAVLAWGLSAGIVAPLLKVAATVERFGRGDLSARIETRRKDEIGTVARSFNSMAERIETLMTAERRLIQDVSHELRSPLARLSFAAELMKNAPDQEAAAARLRREVERLTRLVSTLVEMTSAEGDPAARKRQHVELRDLVQEIVDDCTIEAETRKVRIDVGLPDQARVEGDPELLRRAIENVLRNAIRYAPAETSVKIKLALEGNNAEVVVRDFGPGVPEEKLARIFDPFYRADDSRDPSSGGIGLGLSIARRAIHLHLGQISARNASPGLEVKLTIAAVQGTAVPQNVS
ncbi:MAG TPA: HAMP domain-containing sensor histidine kinase [Terriglobales bacterium]